MDDLAFSVNSILMSDDSIHDKSSDHSVTNLASNIHPRLDVFKRKIKDFKSSQEERRREILLQQKKKRENAIDSNRINQCEKQEENDKHLNTRQKNKKYSINPQYVEQLMFSEWLEDRPDDLDINWIMVVCPVGKRCLVVARDGCTSVYNKGGKLISRHSSSLPGGSKDSRADVTILDCIYSDILRCYFVLDCLCWKSHPILDSDSEFRFYWINVKLNEFSNLKNTSQTNPYTFINVTRIEKLTDLRIEEIFKSPFGFEIDGVLFYHKEGHYSSGYTPLVGWLKLYMIPEILNIPIPSWIKVPSDYLGFKKEITESKKQRENLENFLKNNFNKNSDELDEDSDLVDHVSHDPQKKFTFLNNIENDNKIIYLNNADLNLLHQNTSTANNGNKNDYEKN